MSRARAVPVGLLLACHPLPTAAVTALGTALAVASGRSPAGVGLVAVTLLTGQLSIGWLNDFVDRQRDAAAGRADKPLATGQLPARTVAAAAAVAGTACIPLSFASGWQAGIAHLLVVGAGWAYDLGAKSTAFSVLPYLVAFGSLPAFVVYGLPGHPAPPWWLVLAGALLGAGAHGANVLPDLDDDAATGVRGLPHRLGPGRTRAATTLLLLAAVGVLVVGPTGPPGLGDALAAAFAVTLAVVALLRPRQAGDRTPFLAAVGTGAVAVTLLVARGGVAG